MSLRVGIMGASGYGGGELLRILARHPRNPQIQAASRRNAGLLVGNVHPNLRSIFIPSFVERVDWSWLADAENPVLFLAIPHGESSKQYERFSEEWVKAGIKDRLTVIDLSADFRISDPDLYEKHYRVKHPCPKRIKEWAYGFPELNGAELKGKRRISNPGCFATALQLGLLPLTKLRGIGFVAASGATGSSGSGAEPSETTHHPTRSNDFRPYKVLAHQHLAEVTQLLNSQSAKSLDVSFVPHSAPIVRGILLTLQFPLPNGENRESLENEFVRQYKGAPFVRVIEGPPRVAAVAGSNYADIGAFAKDGHGAVVVALDNLLKGMSGQAVQNMNLALGFDEAEGLEFVGGFPY